MRKPFVVEMTATRRSEVHLREVQEADLPVMFEHQFDPEANRMAAFPPRDREAFMAHWAKILKNPSGLTRAIVANGEVVGNVVSFDASGERLVGYWIGRDHWGRGFASRALAEFLSIEKTRPLQARVAKHNLGSIRVLEKCGFNVVEEDRFSNSEGEQIDEWVMSLDK